MSGRRLEQHGRARSRRPEYEYGLPYRMLATLRETSLASYLCHVLPSRGLALGKFNFREAASWQDSRQMVGQSDRKGNDHERRVSLTCRHEG